MNREQERHAARMKLANAAATLAAINRLPRTTPEQIRRQRERRGAFYESMYQARTTLARLKPRRSKSPRNRKPPTPRPPRPVDPRQTTLLQDLTARTVEAASGKE